MLIVERGFQITHSTPKSSTLNLFQHGTPAFSHLIILPTKAKGLGPALSANLLVDFINQESNILLALSSEYRIPAAISSLLLELDISLPADKNSLVVDHFSYDAKSASEKHNVLVLPSPQFGRKDVQNYFSVDGAIVFPNTVGQVLGDKSPLLYPVVSAPTTAYTYHPKEENELVEDPFATGNQISLVTAFQARNSARLTVLGSAEMLEDKWFTARSQSSAAGSKIMTPANREFAKRVSAWTFHELGVLNTGPVKHRLDETVHKGSTAENMAVGSYFDTEHNPNIYRIKNRVAYSIAMSEWDIDHWKPFLPAPGDHVQLEVSMLSPFHRLNLVPSPTASTFNATVYTSEFRLPDQHGIFNFLVSHRRPFLANVEEKRTVTVRHFAHDEWPRSFVISGAWPWISGIWVTVGAWVVFVALWLYSKPEDTAKREKR